MNTEQGDSGEKAGDEGNIEDFLEQKRKFEESFQEKFTRVLTVMFTDLKGSTTIAETEGDLGSRMLIKHHNDILFPVIKQNNGVLVKTIGDGTLSYFEKAQDGLRAATTIQQGIDKFNATKTLKIPILIRIGLHTGKCIFEKNDIFGDVVNTASRFESSANPGEVYFSEETYEALSDKSEIYCRYIKDTHLKGKKEQVKVYKAFWNPNEIQKDISAKPSEEKIVQEKGMSVALKFFLAVAIPIILIFIAIQIKGMIVKSESESEKRSISQSASEPAKNEGK